MNGVMKPLVFGPVASRRLGQSLGINHVPPDVCSYACVYAHRTDTPATRVEREPIADPEQIAGEVRQRLDALRGQAIDHVTFVSTGEPTLDSRLGETIARVRRTGVKVAVMTDGSLLWRHDVRQELAQADVVSITVDAARRDAWRQIAQPAPRLRLDDVLAGIRAFAETYRGTLLTQTTVVRGINDDQSEMESVADYLQLVEPSFAYLAVPTHPGVRPASDEAFTRAYAALADHLPRVACLFDEDDQDTLDTPHDVGGLMAIAAERPMERQEVEAWLKESSRSWSLVQALVDDGALRVVEYRGRTYFSPRRRE